MTGKKLEPSVAQDRFAEAFKKAALPKLKAAKKLAANKEYVEASGRRFILAYPFTQNPIKLLRNFMGITQKEAGAILEISQAALSSMETGDLDRPILISHMFKIAAEFDFEVAITNAPSAFAKRETTPEQQAIWEESLSPQEKFENGWSYFGSGSPIYSYTGTTIFPEPHMLFKSFDEYQDYMVRLPFQRDINGRPGQFCDPLYGTHDYVEGNIVIIPYPDGKIGREICATCSMTKLRVESADILEADRIMRELRESTNEDREPENFLLDEGE